MDARLDSMDIGKVWVRRTNAFYQRREGRKWVFHTHVYQMQGGQWIWSAGAPRGRLLFFLTLEVGPRAEADSRPFRAYSFRDRVNNL